MPDAGAERAGDCSRIAQAELKLWDKHTKDGFVAGSRFTLAGAQAEQLTPCHTHLCKDMLLRIVSITRFSSMPTWLLKSTSTTAQRMG